SVSPKDVREELSHAGMPKTLWKDVVSQARRSLSYRDGRYYYVAAVSPSLREEHRHQRAIQRTIRRLVRQHRKSSDQVERRREGRTDFIQPVKVQTEDQREFTLLSRDLSVTGLRLIGTRSLLGQKVRVTFPGGTEVEPASFVVRILWTCAVGDQLFENGGTFLETIPGIPPAERGCGAGAAKNGQS